MRVEYSKRAIVDLAKAAADSRTSFGETVAAALEMRIREVVARIVKAPESVRELSARPGVHVVPLGRYPYKLFYRIMDPDRIKILSLRHTSRRPWEGQR